MVGPIRTRLACDRCHAQKLRCPKQAGSRVCARCAKMGVPCVLSPVNKSSSQYDINMASAMSLGGPPAHQTALDSNDDFGAAMNVAAASWLANGNDDGGDVVGGSFNLDGMLGLPAPDSFFMGIEPDLAMLDGTTMMQAHQAHQESQGSQGDVAAAAASASTDSGSRTDDSNGKSTHASSVEEPLHAPSEVTFSQRLTQLLADTDTILNRLPPEAAMHTSVDPSLFAESTKDFEDKYAKKDLLERVFDATQRLTDAYTEACAPDSSMFAKASPPCTLPDCLHKTPVPGPLADIEAAFDASGLEAGRRTVDLVVPNLLASAHMRLLDVLLRVTRGMLFCFKSRTQQGGGEADFADGDLTVPDLQMGSFVPSKGAAAMMQAFLLRHLLGTLSQTAVRFAQVAAEEKAEGEGDDGGNAPPLAETAKLERKLLKLQFELLNERHTKIIYHLEQFGMYLAGAGLLK